MHRRYVFRFEFLVFSLWGALFCLLLLLPLPAQGASARDLVDEGNLFYATGDYDKALDAYERGAKEQQEPSPEIDFNKGNVYFRKGDYEKAREAYESAALQTKELSLEARAQYNLGNTAYYEGQKTLQSDPKKALSLYELSIKHYQEALRIDPKMQEAARNIEIVRLKMKDLMDQIKKQEEKAGEQQKEREELQKQLDEVIREQEQELKAGQNLNKQMTENPQTAQEKAREKLSSDQAETKEKTRQISEEFKNQPSQSSDDPTVADHLDKAVQEQTSALDKMRDNPLDESLTHQEKALNELKEAKAKLNRSQEKQQPEQDKQTQQSEQDKPSQKSQEEQKEQEQQESSSQPTQEGEPKTRAQQNEEGRDMQAILQEDPEDILREEKEDRLERQRAIVGKHRGVDKDW